MAYDGGLAQRVREALEDEPMTERKMFGGMCFMLRGNMCCGVAGDDLMLRVGPDAYEEALSADHVREMDFTGKPLRGMVYVAPEGIEEDDDLRAWLKRGIAFVGSLPAK